MHEITAEYHSSNMRICQMTVKLFDGLVRVKKSETLENDDGSLETREFFRPVLSKRTINAGNALRAEISRGVGQVGFKAAPLGVLVDTRGLEFLKEIERDAKEKAEQIRNMMLEDLIESNESETLARCEVDLIALKLHPEEEFAEQVERLLSEAVGDKLSEEADSLNRLLSETLVSLGAGQALVAQKKLSVVGRFLSDLSQTQADSNELALAREDLSEAKRLVGLGNMMVGDKIEQLKRLSLFDGFKLTTNFQVG